MDEKNFIRFNDLDHKMPDDYLKHKVFDDLKYMMEFYDSLSCSCFSFVASGTEGIVNYASYVYSSIEGTLDSITTLLTKGRINDAYTLIRKLFDDILLEIYMDVNLKDKFSLENYIVEEVNEWIQGKHRIPKSEKILKYLKTSERTRDLYPLFGWDTYLKKNRELLDDSVHSNRYHLMLLNCNRAYIANRERHLKNCEIVLNQLFLLHLSFIFHLNPQYLMAFDYIYYMDEGLTPPEGSEAWIASFAQDAFDKVIKPHKAIANFILTTCYLEIQRHS